MKYSDNIVTHREKNGIEYLTFNKLDKYSDKIMVEVTLRRGGVSSSIYRSLNFRNLGRDKIENVIKNVEKMCEINDINIENVYKANQAHTDNILVVDNENKNEFSYLNFSTREYDAYIIKEKNTYNFVTTADCNPIVVYDTKNNIIANIHAGWKGVLKRIYLKAVEKMVNYTYTKTKDISKEALLKEYKISSNDIINFKNTKGYIPGNSDPFAREEETNDGTSTGTNTSGNKNNSNGTNNSSTSNSAQEAKDKTTNSNGGIENPPSTSK